MAISIEILNDISDSVVDEIVSIQVDYFAEYPYLQKLDKSLLKQDFHSRYPNKKSIFVVARDGKKMVSANVFIPFSEQKDQVTSFDLWFRRNNEDKKDYVYGGLTLTIPEYRSQGVVKQMAEETDKHLKKLGYKGRMLYSIVRPTNDPKAPVGFRQPSGYFVKRGYEHMKLKPVTSSWVDIGDEKPTEKMFELYVKRL